MAGSGKTTLAAGFIAQNAIPCLWYRLDEGDEDLASFFYYLGMAGEKASTRNGPDLPLLTPEYLPNITTFSKRYFEALCDRLDPPLFFVFDDFHKILPHSGFHEIFQNGIAMVPFDFHVLILSRTDPPAPFMRMLANNRMQLITHKDFKLNLSESKKIAEIASGRRLPKRLTDEIYKKTQGWAAGLILMAKGFCENDIATETIRSSKPEDVFSYFAEELFHVTEEIQKEFLKKCAFLPIMTASMARHVSGIDHTSQILDLMERNHLFTERFSFNEPVFQFHPLFREFLLTQAKASLPDEEIKRLQLKAADVLAACDYVEEAADLYNELGEAERLFQLIEKQAETLLEQGRNKTLAEWIKRLPEDTLQQNPWTYYWLGASCRHFSPAEARNHFETAFHLFNAKKDRRGVYLAWSGIVGSTLYEWNDFTPLNRWINWMEKDRRTGNPFPTLEIEATVAVSMMSALLFCRPHHADMTMWVEKALALSRQHGDYRLCIEAADWAITYYSWSGQFAKAEIIKTETGRLMEASRAYPPGLLHWKWLDISACIFYGIPDESTLHEVSEALEIAENTGIGTWKPMFLLNGVFVALILGDFQKAEECLERLEPMMSPERQHGQGIFYHSAALCHFLKGDMNRALEHARTALAAIEKTGYVFPTIVCRFGLSQILMERGDFEEAAAELLSSHELSVKTRSPALEFMCLAGKAWLVLKQGRDETEKETLRNLMVFGRKHAFQGMIWWWHPEMMSCLCTWALYENIEVDYCRRLILIWGLKPENPPYAPNNWPWAMKIHTFDRFEIWINGDPLPLSSKAHSRPFELLKALIARGGRNVGIEKIKDDLWAEADGDMAHSAFSTNLNRLRKILTKKDLILLHDGCLTLNRDFCWLDTWVFETHLKEAENLWKRDLQQESMTKYEEAIGIYRGLFLSRESLHHWMVPLRERLSLLYLKTLVTLGRALEKKEAYNEAIRLYERGLEADNLEETFYRRVMICYEQLGRHADAVKVYLRCRDTFASELDVSPADETNEIYNKIISHQKSTVTTA